MEFNFFGWIREGVKRSVLLGVADAVEEMGAPPDEKGQPALFESLRDNSKAAAGGGRRKRLGRSLKDAA